MNANQAIQIRLNNQVYNYTLAMYCQRFSKSDYGIDINSAKLKIEELIELAHLMGIYSELSTIIPGYLNIKINLDIEFPLVTE